MIYLARNRFLEQATGMVLIALLAACQPTPKNDKNAELDELEFYTWKYSGNRGPDNWALIHKEYHACADGQYQSPINIKDSYSGAHEINFDYSSSHEVIENTGNMVELKYDSGSVVNFDGTDYQLIKFHFHTPSEHHIFGEKYPLEVHLVHRSIDTTYLVIGVFFEKGAENKFLSKFIVDAPQEVEEKRYNKDININQLFPSLRNYFYYQGSFTTPPCTEGVRWVMMENPVKASALQIRVLELLDSENSRPLQEIHDRIVEHVINKSGD